LGFGAKMKDINTDKNFFASFNLTSFKFSLSSLLEYGHFV